MSNQNQDNFFNETTEKFVKEFVSAFSLDYGKVLEAAADLMKAKKLFTAEEVAKTNDELYFLVSEKMREKHKELVLQLEELERSMS